MNRILCHLTNWFRIALGLVFALVLADGARAQCPNLLFYEDLVTGLRANLSQGNVSRDPDPNPDPECPMELLKLTINIPDGCSRAVIWTHFEGQPSGWTVNFGDSPTNNGFGGDFGSTPRNAELQILNDVLTVYNAVDAPPVDPVASQHLALTDSALNFVVENQRISWSPPYSELNAPNLELLFAIPDATPGGDGRQVYLGLNRVIDDGTNRVGCGVRRVMVSFE